jgi:hypothetical protein
MADAEKYAQWIVDNKDKKGTPEFETVAKAYQVAKSQSASKSPLLEAASLLKGGVMNLGDIGRGMIGESAKFAGRVVPGVTGEELQSSVESRLAPKQVDDNRMITSKDFASIGRGATDVGAAFAVPSAIGFVASKIPQAAKYAELLSSSGFNIGNAATKSKLANALLRSSAGAATSGATGGLIDPESAGTSAVFGALAPPGFDLISKALGSGANKLMTSALKPNKKQLESGEGAKAVKTMLEEGVNPTLERTMFGRGIDTLEGKIGELNNEISNIIQNSTGTVSKSSVINYLDDLLNKAKYSLAPESDMAAVQAVKNQFIAHPLATMENIPVQLAQKLKQGTYKSIGSKNFNELGGSTKEALRAGSKGLKEGIAAAEPSVSALNAREGDLINALDVAESRAYQALKNNPAGLAGLAQNPTQFALMLADRSDAFKALMARMMYQTGKAVNQSSKMPIGAIPAVAASQGEQ